MSCVSECVCVCVCVCIDVDIPIYIYIYIYIYIHVVYIKDENLLFTRVCVGLYCMLLRVGLGVHMYTQKSFIQYRNKDGWMVDGWMDGWTDGRTDGGMDGWTDRSTVDRQIK